MNHLGKKSYLGIALFFISRTIKEGSREENIAVLDINRIIYFKNGFKAIKEEGGSQRLY